MMKYTVIFAGPVFTREFTDLDHAVAWALPQLPLKRGWSTEIEVHPSGRAARVHVRNSKDVRLKGYGCRVYEKA